MKLYKIGQPWQNELLIDNKTRFIDNKNARFACQSRKLATPNPGLEKVVQFCLTFLSGKITNPNRTLVLIRLADERDMSNTKGITEN